MEQILNQVNNRNISSLLIDAYIMSNVWFSLQDKAKNNSIVNVRYVDETDCINQGIKFFFADYG